MNNKDFVDVNFEEIKNEMQLTAPQVAQKINDTDTRVRFWADSFGDLIGIEKVNGRKVYKESDVEKFAFIKDLLDRKHFTHDQAKIYLSKNGFKYAKYDSGLVDTKDPLGFQALASALSVEVENKLENFMNKLTEKNQEQLAKFLEYIVQTNLETKAEIESSVDEIVSEKLDTHLQEFKSYVDEKERQATSKDIEMIDILKQRMDERKELQDQLEEEKNKPFWKRLFKK